MSLSGKKAEKEQLSPSCLLSASFPLSFRSRYLRYAAMIFCVLVMSVGQAWGTPKIASLNDSTKIDFTKNPFKTSSNWSNYDQYGNEFWFKDANSDTLLCCVSAGGKPAMGATGSGKTGLKLGNSSSNGGAVCFYVDAACSVAFKSSSNNSKKTVYFVKDAARTKVTGTNYSSAGTDTLTSVYHASSGTQAVSDTVLLSAGYYRIYCAAQWYLDNIEIFAAASCTAPTSPSVSPTNGWIYVPGEEIELTASATGTSSTTTYTWYRGATLDDAVDAGAIQDAATAAGGNTYTIASCTASDAYKYWCVISNGTGCEASASYDIKVYTFFLYNNDHTNNSSHAFTYIDRTNKKLSVTFDVENSDYTYYFKVSDGLGTWFGKDAYTITSSTNYCNGLSSSGANVGWTTTYPGSYTIDYYYESNNIVIIYPTHNQTAGQTIYFDNHLTDMSNMYIRIGNKSYASASSAITTLVAGTKSLYQASTIAWDGFYAWSIADNQGWQSDNTIYQPWNDGGTIKPNGGYTITKQTVFQNYVVGETITLIPTAVNNTEYGCTYYSVDKYSGQKTYTVTTSDNTNCTVTLQKCTNYGSSTYTSLSSGETVLPTQYIKVTITPTAGYEYSSISITNATEVTAPTAGSPVGVYYVTGNSAISVTCSAASYTVTLNNEDATTAGAASVSATYGSAMPSIAADKPAKTGYTFGGYYSAAAGSGTKYYNADGSSAKTSDFTAAGNLYALWTQSVTIDDNGGSADGSVDVTYKGMAGTPSVPTYAGHTVDLGYYAESSCTNKVMALDGTLQTSVTDGSSVVWTNSSSKWAHAGASTLYAHWKCNTPTITDNGDNTVTITVPSGTTVRYTTDGTNPTSSTGTVYSSPFSIVADCTVKAIAYQSGCTDSEVVSEDCTYSGGGGELTALVSGTLYKVEDMVPSGTVFGEDDVYKEGLSANTKFFLVGSASSSTTVKFNNNESNQKTIDGTSFTNSCWFGGEASLTDKTPTTKAIKFELPSAGTLYIYFYDNNKGGEKIKLALEGEDPCWSSTKAAAKATKESLSAGTYYLYATSGSTAIYGLQFDAAVPCSTDPTVTAGSNSSVGSTTATVICASGISALGTGGCTITEYGFVIGESANPEIGGSGVTKHVVGTTYTTTGTSFSKDLTGLTAETTYYVRPYATNGHGTAYGTQTSFTTTAAPTLYTVTFNSNGGSAQASITQASEDASITMPAAPTKASNTFQGWVIGGTTYAAGASYTPTANITAYASWKENCTGGGGGGSAITWDFTDMEAVAFTNGKSYSFTADDGDTEMRYSAGSSDAIVAKELNKDETLKKAGYLKENGTTGSATVTDIDEKTNVGKTRLIRLFLTGTGTLNINCNGDNTGTYKVYNGSASGTLLRTFKADTACTRLTVTTSPLWIETTSKGYINTIVWTPASSRTCFYVTYNGNGAEAGSISDETAYAASDEVTVSSNTGASAFTKSGYHVGSWNTAANGSGTTYALGATFNISSNVTLYAQWVADACSAPSEPTISGTSVRTAGQTIELTAFCESGKDASTTYTWYKGNTWETTSQVQAPLTIEEGGRIFNKASCTTDDTGKYWCKASNGDGCESHNATGFTVTVNDAVATHIYYYKDADHYDSETGTYYTPEGNTATQKDNQNLSSPWMICNGCMTGVDSVVAHNATYDGKGNHMNAYIKLPTDGNATTNNIKFALSAGYTGTLTIKIGGYNSNPTVTLQPLNTSTGVLGSAITPTSGEVGGVATTEDNFYPIVWPLSTAGGTYVLKVTSKTGYISQIDMTTSTSATFNVTYNGNGNTGGTVPTDATNYAPGATVTVAANTGDGKLVKTNYTGAGWNTANNGTGTNYVPGTGTFSITANTTLYAHWTQLITLAPGTQGTGTSNAAVSWNGSVLRGFAAHTASGYALQGYYTEPSGGTKVLNADGSFAATNIDGFVNSGKWSNTGAAPTLYAQWEASSLLKWNLKVNVAETSITTLSKESAAPTVIAVANMGNLTNNGSLTITGSAKSALTSKIATTDSDTGDDAGKYMSVRFVVAAGYQLKPSDIKVKVQPISHSQTTKLILEDNNSQSISYTSGSLSKGSTHTVTMTNSEEVTFTGTVTLKIYVYGTAESDGYRLGTPIEINGSVEETCTPPTFSGISYSATEYTVGASASAISVTGATNVGTYLWKQNDVNDRSGGTAASGTNNLVSYTPPTSAADTMYYWCEMTNGCTTVKTAAVGIMVRNATTDPTVTWSDVKLNDATATPNYGGGNYVLRATVNETSWPGTLAASMITAPAGITIHHVTTGKADNKNYIEFKFDVTTAFDRASNATIDFNLALPEAGSYSALNSVKSVNYNDCSGGAAGQVAIKMGATASTSKSNPQNYWETAGAGRLMYNYGSNMGSSYNSAGYRTADSTFYYYAASTGQKWMFQTYIAGVNKVRVAFRAAGTIKSSKATITNFYYNTEYFSSPGSNAVSFGDVNANKAGYSSGEDGYIEFTVPEMAANSYGAFVTADGNMKVYGVVLYSENAGGGGSVPTNPVWSGGLANDGTATVSKNQSDANFSYTISTTTNTLGAITYSSSNPSCAAVDPVTGEVTITATGTETQTAVITATLARSGCYQGATRTYTIEVEGQACTIASAGTLAITAGSATKCASEEVTLTLSGHDTDGTTVTWYQDDTDVTSSVLENSLTTTAAGTFSVVVSKSGCSLRSNSITIANMDMSEQKTVRKVSQWYVKNGRLTPDIALWQLGEGETFKSVAWSPSYGTGLDFVTRNGIVYLEGKEPSTNTSGADIPYTLTLTITDACGTDHELSGQTIKLTHQKNTDKHVLAFVVNGTAKGGFTEGITAAQTTSVGLYNAIAANFDVQATNIYSTDDEQKLREYYSQYDILCITDYPNTQTKGANSKSYVDAIGALIDIRPILTMEAFVSSLANWKAKGISGNPKSPTTRQYAMDLQCKDHEVFSGVTTTKIGEGDEAMYRVTMVDKNQEEYKTLDANYGDAEHKANEGYQYGKKPALQGFTYTEAMSENDLLPLGLIDDGADNDLQVGIERQHEMSARLMVLGINSYAMERLTEDGEKVVINALKYLMKKNAEDISDCSVYFDGSDKTDSTSWDNELNWGPSYASLPLYNQEVRILKPCVVKSGTVVRASGIKIIPSGRINHDTDNASGSLTIEPGGALIVDGKVRAAVAPNYFNATPTTPANLYIAADETNGNGTLIFDNEDGETQATVGYYSKATTDENTTWNWQYMAVPFNDNSSAYRNFYDSYLYRWAENCSGWEVVPNQGAVYPWVGYTITQVGQKMYYMDGTLVETGEQTFTVPAGKNLVVGNSWTAPIQVKQFEDADFAGMSKNIYLFNTGYDPDGEGTFDKADGRYEGGTYVTIPIHSSTYTGDSLISSLQAFIVYAKTAEGGGTFTLDYDRHVRPARSTDKVNAGPMHAPKRGGVINDKPAVLKVWASGSRYDDRLIVLEREDFSTGLDEGWDGNKRVAGNSSPLIFAVTDNGREAVSAIPTMEGTLIGFWAGEDNEYTLHFEYNEEDELYLLDLDNNTYTPVNSNSTYVFTVPDKKAHNRFILTRNAPDPVATGVEETQANEKPEAKAIKFLKDEKVFIFVNGKLYDATGKVVK